MKKSMIFLGLLSIGTAYAQRGNVGINTVTPNATLELKVADVNANNDTNQGILIPKLTKERVAAIADPKLVKGTLVFVENTAYTGSNAKVVDINTEGYYHYNGTKWTRMEGDGVVGNEVLNATTDRGLERVGNGTAADPYTLGVRNGGITGEMIADGAINLNHLSSPMGTNCQLCPMKYVDERNSSTNSTPIAVGERVYGYLRCDMTRNDQHFLVRGNRVIFCEATNISSSIFWNDFVVGRLTHGGAMSPPYLSTDLKVKGGTILHGNIGWWDFVDSSEYVPWMIRIK